MTNKNRIICAILCMPAAWTGACRKGAPPVATGPGRVEINGHSWRVECVATKAAREIGMSGRSHLAEDAGMLFVYPSEFVMTFWMQGCEIPLDIAFIGADMKVVAIHTMLVEADRRGRETYSSVAAAQYALEVPGGALGRAGVQVGQKVTFTGNITDAAKAESP